MKPTVPSIQKIDRLLIVKTSSIGDVIHALPVVELLKRSHLNMEIGWVVKQRCAGVLEGNPWITRLHVVPDSLSFSSAMQIARELRAARYQVALDMQGLLASGIYTLLSGAPIRIGIDRNREGNKFFLTHPIVPGKPDAARTARTAEAPTQILWGSDASQPPSGADSGERDRTISDRHAVEILYGFADVLGAGSAPSEFEPQPYLASGSDPAPSKLVANVRETAIGVVALNVGASSKYKQWPAPHWVALTKQLLAARVAVVFVGDRADATIVESVKAQLSPSPLIVDVSGKTTLRQLAAVLTQCDVMVTGDTGPMHMAVAVGTPVVALFGSTNPARTGPYGARNVVLDVHLPCSPCYRKPTCDGRVDCMVAITPEAVFTAVSDKLGGDLAAGERGAVHA